jgi:hypothetical protein
MRPVRFTPSVFSPTKHRVCPWTNVVPAVLVGVRTSITGIAGVSHDGPKN